MGEYILCLIYYQTFKLLEGNDIDWVAGSPPKDEPDCGYYGEKCIQPPSNILASMNSYITIDYKKSFMTSLTKHKIVFALRREGRNLKMHSFNNQYNRPFIYK